MITLKEAFLKSNKEKLYTFYTKVIKDFKTYNKITKEKIYEEIINKYEEDPEVILELCTMEELQILKSILDGNNITKNNGYIEYLLFSNLKDNYLIFEDHGYYIPSDLINYVKMAFNLFQEKTYSYKDVIDSVMIGMVRIYNVLTFSEALSFLHNYNIVMTEKELESCIHESIKFTSLIKVVNYKKEKYIVSNEFFYFKDILPLKKSYIKYKQYDLEEVISIGKYKINLFRREIFEFLNFLEKHLESIYVHQVIYDVILYAGFDLKNDDTLFKIADSIEPLYEEIKKVILFFPVWIYNGNVLESLKSNVILPKRNEPCLCGSGKKFKNCCMKKFKKN